MGKLITAPFAWIMRVLYSLTGSYGITLILFTVIVKLVMLPFQLKSKKSMVRMGRLGDKQKELEKKYGNNKQKYNEELTKLYEEAGVNPMSGCLWSMLPLFILIPLYNIIRQPITHFMRLSADALETIIGKVTAMGMDMSTIVQISNKTGEIVMKDGYTQLQPYGQIGLTRFISDNWSAFEGQFDGLMNIDFNFIGLDLTINPTAAFSGFVFDWFHIGLILIPIVSGALSFAQSKISASSNGQQANGQMKTMLYMTPLMSVYIGFIMPASLGVYWIANSVLMIVQDATLGKYFDKKIRAEEDEREAKREAARQLRMEEAKRHAEEEKKNPQKKEKKQPVEKKKVANPTNEAGRVGERPYARGRSYVENRYDK